MQSVKKVTVVSVSDSLVQINPRAHIVESSILAKKGDRKVFDANEYLHIQEAVNSAENAGR